MMKHLVYLALAAGALAIAMTGCDDVAAPKPAAPPAAAPAPTPATPAAEYSCGDGYIFDSDQVPGPEGAVVNDVFYWGSSTSGAARCFSDTRNNSIVGRVESNAGDAIAATTMSVTLSGERRWYLILEFSDGTYCSAATAGDGRATCFATVERDATGFGVDDLPAVPLPVPEGAPERPVADPPGGPGPGGGDVGGGHTGAPEPEEPVEEDPVEEDPVEEEHTTFHFGTHYLVAAQLPERPDGTTPAPHHIYAPIKELRWYILLGSRDDGRPHTHCFAAITGDGRATCSSDKIRLNTLTHSDDFPTPTAPQSSAGNDAVWVSPFFYSQGAQQQMIEMVGHKLPGWPDHLPSNDMWWFLILELSDGTFCNAATAGDGRVTCVGTVEKIPNFGAFAVPYVP